MTKKEMRTLINLVKKMNKMGGRVLKSNCIREYLGVEVDGTLYDFYIGRARHDDLMFINTIKLGGVYIEDMPKEYFVNINRKTA